MRKEFEKWAREEPRYFNICRSGEDYYYPSVQDAWVTWQAALAVRSGSKVVPIKPTGAMLMAGHKNGGGSVSCGQIWDAMVSASPGEV